MEEVSTAVVVEEVSTAVAVAAAFMAAEAAGSIVGVEEGIVAAAPTEARRLSVEEAPTGAAVLVAGRERAPTERAEGHTADSMRRAAEAAGAGVLHLAAIPVHSEIVRRIFTRRSATDSGTRSETPAVPRVRAEDVIPVSPPVIPLITAEGRAAAGTALAHQGRPPVGAGLRNLVRFAAALVSIALISADPLPAILLSLDRVPVAPRSDLFPAREGDRTRTSSAGRASILTAASTDLAAEGLTTAGVGVETRGVETLGAGTAGTGPTMEGTAGMAMVGEGAMDTGTAGAEAIGPATVGVAASMGWALAGALEAGASAWDGRIGEATGEQAGGTAGIPGGTARITIRRGRHTTTTHMGLTTIRRLTIRMRMTTMRPQATRSRRA